MSTTVLCPTPEAALEEFHRRGTKNFDTLTIFDPSGVEVMSTELEAKLRGCVASPLVAEPLES